MHNIKPCWLVIILESSAYMKFEVVLQVKSHLQSICITKVDLPILVHLQNEQSIDSEPNTNFLCPTSKKKILNHIFWTYYV